MLTKPDVVTTLLACAVVSLAVGFPELAAFLAWTAFMVQLAVQE